MPVDAVVALQERIALVAAALADPAVTAEAREAVAPKLAATREALQDALATAGIAPATSEPTPRHREVVAATAAAAGALQEVIDGIVQRQLEASRASLAEAGGDPQDAASGLKAALGVAAGPAAPYEARELGTKAYVILAVAILIIFGGLAWCFWQALQAAGRQDAPLEPEADEDRDHRDLPPPDPGV